MTEREELTAGLPRQRLAIIIVNWNSSGETIACLQNLFRNDLSNTQILILDNGSIDGSVDNITSALTDMRGECGITFTVMTRDALPNLADNMGSTSVIIVSEKENLGFAGGCNILIDLARKTFLPDIFLFLNSDIRMNDDVIERMVSKHKSDTEVGMWAPIILFNDEGEGDVIFSQGGSLNLWRGLSPSIGIGNRIKNDAEGHLDSDYLSGAFLMVDSEVLDEIGLFDPTFFAYWEETDLCLRARNKGYVLRTYFDVRVKHKVSASTPGDIKLYYLYRNSILFMRKNATPLQFFSFTLYAVLFNHWKKAAGMIYNGNSAQLRFINRALIDGLLSKGGMINSNLIH